MHNPAHFLWAAIGPHAATIQNRFTTKPRRRPSFCHPMTFHRWNSIGDAGPPLRQRWAGGSRWPHYSGSMTW